MRHASTAAYPDHVYLLEDDNGGFPLCALTFDDVCGDPADENLRQIMRTLNLSEFEGRIVPKHYELKREDMVIPRRFSPPLPTPTPSHAPCLESDAGSVYQRLRVADTGAGRSTRAGKNWETRVYRPHLLCPWVGMGRFEKRRCRWIYSEVVCPPVPDFPLSVLIPYPKP